MDKNKKLRKVYFREVEWYPVWVVENSDGLPPVGIEVEVSEKDYKEIMDTFKKFKKTQDKIEKLVAKRFSPSNIIVGLDEAMKKFKELHEIMKEVVDKFN